MFRSRAAFYIVVAVYLSAAVGLCGFAVPALYKSLAERHGHNSKQIYNIVELIKDPGKQIKPN